MFGKDFSSVLKLAAYGDGSADINMMGDEGVISWTETEDNGYKLSYTGSEAEGAGEMTCEAGRRQTGRNYEGNVSVGRQGTGHGDEIHDEVPRKEIQAYRRMGRNA